MSNHFQSPDVLIPVSVMARMAHYLLSVMSLPVFSSENGHQIRSGGSSTVSHVSEDNDASGSDGVHQFPARDSLPFRRNYNLCSQQHCLPGLYLKRRQIVAWMKFVHHRKLLDTPDGMVQGVPSQARSHLLSPEGKFSISEGA